MGEESKLPGSETKDEISILVRISRGIEYWIVTRLIPQRVGPVMKRVFRLPIYFHRMGLSRLNGSRFLLLATQGRVTGKIHTVALEYGFQPEEHVYDVMANWGGKNDWYQNALANPNIWLSIEGRSFAGSAKAADTDYVVRALKAITQINPKAPLMWSKLSGVEIDGTEKGWQAVADYFPMLLLKPEQEISDFSF